MVMLVSYQMAKRRLRIDTEDDKEDVEQMIGEASEMVINYLKKGATFLDTSGGVDTDTDGNPIGVPYAGQSATFTLVGILYHNRQGEAGIINPQWSQGYLPPSVTAILYPLRDPAME